MARAAKKARKAASEGTSDSGEGETVEAVKATDPKDLIQNEDKEKKKRQDAAVKWIKSGIEDLFSIGLTLGDIMEILRSQANYAEPPPAEAPTSTGEGEAPEEG